MVIFKMAAESSISKSIFNIDKSFWCQIVGRKGKQGVKPIG